MVGVTIPPTTNGRGIVLVCVYNPPASDLFSEDFYFLDFLNQSLYNYNILVVGYFNMPGIEWNNLSVSEDLRDKRSSFKFILTVEEFCLMQFVHGPMHVHGNTLDLILTSEPELLEYVLITDPGFSDRFLLSFSVLVGLVLCEKSLTDIRLYDKGDTQAISRSLADTCQNDDNLIEKGADIDEIWFCFQRDLHSELDKNVPTRTPFWFNKHARKLVAKQRKLYNLYKRTRLLHSLEKYQEIRNRTKKFFTR